MRAPFFMFGQQPQNPSFGYTAKWVWVVLKYSDPYGIDRETGYMAKVNALALPP